jgi:hypothetical protein
MPKKGGKKGGKKGKKGPEDWGLRDVEKFVNVELRSSVWESMRFTQRLGTSTKLGQLAQLVFDKHQVAGMQGLNLYLGHDVDENNLLRPEEYGLTLKDINFPCGSLNDHVLQVVTYDYAPHKTADAGMPPSRQYGILNLPRGLICPPLRPMGP